MVGSMVCRPCTLFLRHLRSSGCTSGGRDSFQSVKLQRPDRDTVCSHSVRDATANVETILFTRCTSSWSKLHLRSTAGTSLTKGALCLTRKWQSEDDGSMQKAGGCRFRNRDSSARLTVVQCEQTTVWATLRIMHREEVRQSLQGRVHFILLGRLHHGNNLDRSTGAVFARWRWVGIFAVAPLTRLTDNRVMGLSPWLTQTVKTKFAVGCEILDRQGHFSAF